MNKAKLFKHMRDELDWHAKEYQKYSDPELKESTALEFKHIAVSFNILLNTIYTKGLNPRFSSRVERYVKDREEDNWE